MVTLSLYQGQSVSERGAPAAPRNRRGESRSPFAPGWLVLRDPTILQNDQVFVRDLRSDTSIDCDGGTKPGSADKVDLDLLPKDPDSAVTNCETKTRH